MLFDIQSAKFLFPGDAQPYSLFQYGKHNEGRAPYPCKDGYSAQSLDTQLSEAAAEEQTVDRIEARRLSVFRLREQANAQRPKHAADTMNRDSADRIVNVEYLIKELHRQNHNYSGQ